jgi:hypothetical protein
LLDPIYENLSNVQRQKVQNYHDTVNELKADGLYDSRLNITPHASGVDLETVNLGKNGGVDTYSTQELVRLANVLDPKASTAERDALDTIYGTLFNHATKGLYPDVDDVIRRGPSDQLEAMKALNWVKDSVDDEGNSAVIRNDNVAEHYFGRPGRYASTQLKMMPKLGQGGLDSIANQVDGDYTKGDNLTYLKKKIEGWKEREYEGRSESAPPTVTKRVTVKESTDSGNEFVQENMRRAIEETHAEGDRRAAEKEERKWYEERDLRPSENYKHTNVISDTVSKMNDTVKNWAAAIDDNPGLKKTGGWIAGIGIAAFALHQFMQAASPLRVAQRPDGHGVEGPTGQTADDVSYQSPETSEPNTGNRVYVDAGDKAQGHKIVVRGQAKGDVDYNDMSRQVQDNIGNFNINMNDDRKSLDRKWLEGKFSDYIDRGYVD